jgi:hypothetical protein
MFDRPQEDNQSQANNRKRLTSDELIALFIALTTIGGLLFWLLGRKYESWNLNLFADAEITETQSIGSSEKKTSSERWQLQDSIDESEGKGSNRVNNQGDNGDRDTSSIINPFNFPTITGNNEEGSINLFDGDLFSQSASKDDGKLTDKTNNIEQSSKADSIEPTPPTTSQAFSDVPNDYWARPFIEKLAELKTIEGFPDGTFQPDKPITRAELAAAIDKAFPNGTNNTNLAFKDITAGSEQAKSIDGAIGSGFMKGYPEGVFQPDKQVTRLQTLVALATGLKLQTIQQPADILALFQDGKEVPKWATKQIAAATDKGLVVGYPDVKLLDPNRPATRGEIAVMLYQALVLDGKVPKIDSEYIFTPSSP